MEELLHYSAHLDLCGLALVERILFVALRRFRLMRLWVILCVFSIGLRSRINQSTPELQY